MTLPVQVLCLFFLLMLRMGSSANREASESRNFLAQLGRGCGDGHTNVARPAEAFWPGRYAYWHHETFRD